MNKTALKHFATRARRELLEKVALQARKIGITKEAVQQASIVSSDAVFVDDKQLTGEKKKQRDKLIVRIEEVGFDQVIEEVAYTWFNRLTALRFMEVNDYLPTRVRVLSSSFSDSKEPDMIKEALSLDLDIDKQYVYELKLNNDTETLFKYLIIKHCNELNDYMPFMFEKIDDYTEILFPEGLLGTDGLIEQMTEMGEDDWQSIEIIGWLYQYYIADEKDRVFKAKKKYTAEEIPFATQLFTPKWIVQYMVQNSLGRYWIESHPEDESLCHKWDYFVAHDQANENEIAQGEHGDEYVFHKNRQIDVEQITCLDPAMGSGHILVYVFDLLYDIYAKSGYMGREIPRLIIENNLYGFDIDHRAYQLACFSVVMKALEYDPRFLRTIKRDGLILNLLVIEETNRLTEDDILYLARDEQDAVADEVSHFVRQFLNAKTTGSLIKVEPIDLSIIEERIHVIQKSEDDLFTQNKREKLLDLVPRLVKQYRLMKKKYDVVVTNPPYMGASSMNKDLSAFLRENYPNSRFDLFAAFMEVDHYLQENGFYAAINQHGWMFLSSYEQLRERMSENMYVDTMLHLGPRAFEEIGGEVVQSTAFVLRNVPLKHVKGTYIRLTEARSAQEKRKRALESVGEIDSMDRYHVSLEDFSNIPGQPFAYWASKKTQDIFSQNLKIKDIAEPRQGIATANNKRFLRYWYEVPIDNIGFGCMDANKALVSEKKWFPYNKGGSFRKWYGNQDYVINWENDGKELREFKRSVIRNPSYYFKESITWSFVGSSAFGVRYSPSGFIFDVGGSSLFPNEQDIYYMTGLLTSKLAPFFLSYLNPTLNFQVGNIGNIPLPAHDDDREQIELLAKKAIELEKADWDSFETSWNFTTHPLIKMKESHGGSRALGEGMPEWIVEETAEDSYDVKGEAGRVPNGGNKGDVLTIEQAFRRMEDAFQQRFDHVKIYEEQINEMFIRAYGLQDEMSPQVSDNQITVHLADRERDIKSFISYAVGCLLGRYSLDEKGIVCAGQVLDITRYKTIEPDGDNILPILSDPYMEDDIVMRFIHFVQVVFGEDNIEENLNYIADTLGKKKHETVREVIRRYFIQDFYKDHVKTYKKRPIYWLFSSGKERAFNCLIYMHRYDASTLSRIRTDYLHDCQVRLDTEKEDLLQVIESAESIKEGNEAKRSLRSIDKKIAELQEYDELLHNMADKQIELDLNNGFETNYTKFKGLTAKL